MQYPRQYPTRRAPFARPSYDRAVLLGAWLIVAGLWSTSLPARAQEGGVPPVAMERGAGEGSAAGGATAAPAPGTEMPVEPFHVSGTTTQAAGRHYRGSALRSFLYGKTYRDVWTTTLDVPVVDLSRTAGGLTFLERGGGLQTSSLRFKGGDGHEYVFRSIDKDASRSLPEGFHGTLVADIARNQTVSLNPYGAFIIPPLAEAAGVFHTAPLLVILPDDPRLGEHREEFAGMLVLMERRPDEDQSDAARFGYSRNVVGSEKMLEEISEGYEERVDARAYARARLFDMLIGDWDRHDDQWRWAEFEADGYTRYVAVPRDRDFAFAKFEGAFLTVGRLGRTIVLRRLADFDDEINDLLGLNWQGAKLDLRLTASLTREDWVEIAEDLRTSLPDDAIEAAVRQWPAPVYDEIGAFTTDALKARRDQLPRVAGRYYEMLADVVDVVGTDTTERFEVTRQGDATRVVVYAPADGEGEVVYDRTFHRGETAEVRLYGLGGDDEFVVTGGPERGIRVRAVGGEGADVFTDESRSRSASRATHFYDSEDGNTWEVRGATRVHRSDDPAVNRYEMRRFEFDTARPVLSVDYDSDNGFFAGGGVRFLRHGFRKLPYAASHKLSANYAPRSRAYNVAYEGDFVGLGRGWNALLEADVMAADRYRNFYGLGNETTEDARSRFQAQLQWITAAPMLYRPLGRHATLSFAPYFAYANVEPPDGLSEDSPALGFTPADFVDTYFTGLRAGLVVDSRDSTLYPMAGIRWANEAGVHVGVRGSTARHARLASELAVYRGLDVPLRPSLALRVGGATNVGDFLFYQANTLGGSENLRGYRTTRFAGRTSVYTNAELRLSLVDLNLYVIRGTVGLLGFYDTGRVWTDGEDSSKWHQGYGGGLWLAPFDKFLVSTTLGFSPEGQVFDLSFGFQF